MRLLAALTFAVAVIAIRAPAPAAAGPLVVTGGEDVVHLRRLPAEAQAVLGEGTSLGYRYDAVGLFGLDLWRWDGEVVLYRGRTIYTDVAPAELAELAGVASLDRVRAPFGYYLPPGLALLLAIAGAGLLTLLYRRLVGRHLIRLLDDHRYEHAARMVTQQPTPAWTLDQAVDYLVTLGESRGWARFNLRLLRKHAV
jgi:hypothetical protein